jgi:hypothetical protein
MTFDLTYDIHKVGELQVTLGVLHAARVVPAVHLLYPVHQQAVLLLLYLQPITKQVTNTDQLEAQLQCKPAKLVCIQIYKSNCGNDW